MTTYIRATDFNKFDSCDRLTFLDFHGDADQKADEPPYQKWIFKAAEEHEKNVIARYGDVAQASYQVSDLEQGFDATLKLMNNGVGVIYQGVLIADGIVGIPDLMIKEEGPSRLGGHYYRPLDVKWTGKSSTGDRLQVMAYIALLERIQGVRPEGRLILRVPVEQRHLDPFATVEEKVIFDSPRYEACLQTIRRMKEDKSNEPDPFISSICSSCVWREVCIPIAESRQDISLISGLHRKVWQELRRRGLDTLPAAAAVSPEQLMNIDGVGSKTARYIIRQARALHLGQVIQLKHVQLPSDPPIFFDIESVPGDNLVYLMGLINSQDQFVYDLARSPDEEGRMWEDFISRTKSLKGTIYHYGYFERTVLKRMSEKYGRKKAVKKLLNRMVDLRIVLMESVVLPLRSYSLKSVAPWLGYNWTGDTTAADDSIVEYLSWLSNGDEAHLNNILTYNEHDVRALQSVYQWLISLDQDQQ